VEEQKYRMKGRGKQAGPKEGRKPNKTGEELIGHSPPTSAEVKTMWIYK
jgi:hypothetical protein